MSARPSDLSVQTERGSYRIHFRRDGVIELAGRVAAAARTGRVAIITDATVSGLHVEDLAVGVRQHGPEVLVAEFPAGEIHKTAETVESLYDALLSFGVDRHTPIVALGGGVTGDLAGFVAATLLRGMPCIQVPTTVLSQVDSSVGGKTGYNHRLGKNLVGAFYPPQMVYIDAEYLRTLPSREVRSGLAEVIKHGWIGDPTILDQVEANALALRAGEPEALSRVIEASVRVKARVVEADEREAGQRAVLNFGHTLGHAIEAEAGYGRLTHGEAVALGMMFAARLSERRGLIEEPTVARLERTLTACGLPVDWRTWANQPGVLARLANDKKVRRDEITLVLLDGPGRPRLEPMPIADLQATARRMAGN